MLYWALIFLLIGLLASALGFGGLSAAAFGIAKGLVLFKVLGILLIVAGIGFALSHARRT